MRGPGNRPGVAPRGPGGACEAGGDTGLVGKACTSLGSPHTVCVHACAHSCLGAALSLCAAVTSCFLSLSIHTHTCDVICMLYVYMCVNGSLLTFCAYTLGHVCLLSHPHALCVNMYV